jgi:hypothetical protein
LEAGKAQTYLGSALDDIKGADGGVGQTAGEDTADHALGIVGHVMDVTHVAGLFSLKSQFSLSK